MMIYRTDEGRLCEQFNDLTKRLKRAEAVGVDLPPWLLSLCGGALVVMREATLHPLQRAFLLAGILMAYEAVPANLRRKVDETNAWPAVPDGVPADFE